MATRVRSQRIKEARKKGTHTKDQWIDMKDFFNYECVKCRGESGLLNVEKDHILPLHLGGSDSIKNIQPLCAKCNSSKTNDITDYRISWAIDNNLLNEWLDLRETM